MGVDWENRVDFERLRQYRLARVKRMLAEYDLGAVLLFETSNIRYATATQIIEWGWDSSTPHRNAQLSNDWTHACVSGRFPFYVGIFAHR